MQMRYGLAFKESLVRTGKLTSFAQFATQTMAIVAKEAYEQEGHPAEIVVVKL